MPPPPPRDPPRVKLPPSPGKVARQQLKKTIKYAVKLLRKAEDLGARALEKSELVKRIQQAKLRAIAAPRGRGASKKCGGSAVDKTGYSRPVGRSRNKQNPEILYTTVERRPGTLCV